MYTWKDVKKELMARGRNPKYFNKAFFDIYVNCVKQARRNAEKGIDAFYTDENGILKNGAYDPIFNTKFYNLNGSVYCEFLHVMATRFIV